MSFEIAFGALSPPISEQLDQNGFHCSDSETLDELARVSGEGNFVYNRYFSGLKGEYGRYDSHNGLLINEEHEIIKKIIYISKDKHPLVAKTWGEIYLKLSKIAREITNDYSKNLNMNFLSEKKEFLQDKYEDEKSYYLNTHLSVFFKYDEKFQKFLEDIYQKTHEADISSVEEESSTLEAVAASDG